MKGYDSEPEYRRRIREKAEENKREAQEKEREAANENQSEKISAAIIRIEQQLAAYQHENGTNDKNERRWRRLEVLGLWAAAAVGLIAIIVASCDSHEQRNVMTEQQGTMTKQQVAMEEQLKIAHRQLDVMRNDQRPWISIENMNIINTLTINQHSMSTKLSYVLKNYGKTPALKVLFRAILLPEIFLPKPIDRGSGQFIIPAKSIHIGQEILKTCGNLFKGHDDPDIDFREGYTIFPGETKFDDITAATTKKLEEYGIPEFGTKIELRLIFCVAYTDNAESDMYVTADSNIISNYKSGILIDISGQSEIAKDNLRLIPDMLHAGFVR